ncbi:FAD-dependent oxidoreductase [Rhodobacterales bacterium HKCCE2091]|nr:FAD-dependent oxidoreductase [Rhodobacterales bacterium HKCCE2091]
MAGAAPGRVVIVGAGHGGVQMAASLRQEGYAGEVVLVSGEPDLPYQRPPLSKAYLKTGNETALPLRPGSFFEKNAIDLRLDTRAEAIDRASGEVRTSRGRIGYDHLVLATGARNLRPPVPGLDNAHGLRTLADARQMREALSETRRCVVIGGGFIGLEFAAVARALGHPVTVVEAASRPMSRSVSAAISDRFVDLHRGMGTVIELDMPASAVEADAVILGDGRNLPADFVLLAAGVEADVDLAREAGLDCENGIRTDALLRTSDPAISALGDCASFPDPRTGRHVRSECVQAATDHARTIARRLSGGAGDAYAAVPWFWSDQAEYKLQIAGLAYPSDDSVETPDGAVYRFDGQTLTAVETINDAKTHIRFRKLMGETAVPDRETLLSGAWELAST